jgi:hypothetical protein
MQTGGRRGDRTMPTGKNILIPFRIFPVVRAFDIRRQRDMAVLVKICIIDDAAETEPY